MASRETPGDKAATYRLIRQAQRGDEAAKALLCRQNTGLVKKIALRFVSGEAELEDLMQLGYIGLLKAVYKFDPGYDVMFSTYAVPMILGEIRRYFRDTGRVKISRSLKAEIQALKQAEAHLSAAGGTPRVSEIAEIMGISGEHVLEVMEAAAALSRSESLDESPAAQQCAACAAGASPENRLDQIMLKEEIADLAPRERQVILLRYYRDLTQQQVAGMLGVSQVQVSRIERRALARIRERLR